VRWSCVLALLVGCGPGEEVAAILALDPDVASGGEQYQDHCAQCHNVDGTGISGPNIQFVGDQVVVDVLLDPPQSMRDPVEAARLTDQDIADIAAYVERL
jgi:mono/diheme cytochrome c family protein